MRINKFLADKGIASRRHADKMIEACRVTINGALASLGDNVEEVDEVAVDTTTGNTVMRIDPRYFRPAEVEQLLGCPAKAREQLGWEPKVKFEELVKIMVEGDLRLLDKPGYEIGF